MKKAVQVLFVCVFCIALTACGSSHVGEAKTPSASAAMKGRDCREVLESFAENGFTDIELEKIEDLVTGWLVGDGEVEEVSVGGDFDYPADKWVPASTPVVIRYHTFPATQKTEASAEQDNPAASSGESAGEEPGRKNSEVPGKQPPAAGSRSTWEESGEEKQEVFEERQPPVLSSQSAGGESGGKGPEAFAELQPPAPDSRNDGEESGEEKPPAVLSSQSAGEESGEKSPETFPEQSGEGEQESLQGDKVSGESSGQGSIIIPEQEQTEGPLVWIPTNGGRKYHRKSSCSNMKNPMQVSIETAIASGFTPCKKCY